MKRFLLTILVVACWLPSEAKHMAVIVNKTNNTSNMSAVELTKICQASTRKWPDGKNITLVVRDPSSLETQEALQRIYKMSETEVKSFLQAHKADFLTVDSDESLLKMVQSTPGAVGLVDVYSITSKVNIVKIDGKLPLEQGYLLH